MIFVPIDDAAFLPFSVGARSSDRYGAKASAVRRAALRDLSISKGIDVLNKRERFLKAADEILISSDHPSRRGVLSERGAFVQARSAASALMQDLPREQRRAINRMYREGRLSGEITGVSYDQWLIGYLKVRYGLSLQ